MWVPDMHELSVPDAYEGPRGLAVGWLEDGHTFETGVVETDDLEALSRVVGEKMAPAPLVTCGLHVCSLCYPDAEREDRSRRRRGPGAAIRRMLFGERHSAPPGFPWPSECVGVGTADVVVPSEQGVCYWASPLVVHYVRSHGYRPPAAFLAAVRRYVDMSKDDRFTLRLAVGLVRV